MKKLIYSFSFGVTACLAVVIFLSITASFTIPALPSQPLTPITPSITPQPSRSTTERHILSVKSKVNITTPTHPQYQYHALSLTPSGQLYTNQPFLSRLNATSAWAQFANTNPAPTIAVIDTGFALSHEALTSRWTTNRWDFVHNDADPSTTVAVHGTYTAGLASLLNPNAKLMPLQALDDMGTGYTDQIASAVRYAADHGANIISMSLGGTSDDSYLHSQIDYAISKDVLVVAAAGNCGCSALSYPAAYSEVLSVGASTVSDTRASFSSYGTGLDILAPGTAGDVCSSTISGANLTTAYACNLSGTSMATPIVAGLAALLWQQNPSSPDSLITTLEKTATHVSEMGAATNYLTSVDGYGRILASAALASVTISHPDGLLVSKRQISLSSPDLSSGPLMDSSCSGVPGAICSLILTGPANQSILLGSTTLNSYGYADYNWNATDLGLTPGVWSITATQSIDGQTKTSSPVTITISP